MRKTTILDGLTAEDASVIAAEMRRWADPPVYIEGYWEHLTRLWRVCVHAPLTGSRRLQYAMWALGFQEGRAYERTKRTERGDGNV